MEEVAEKRLSAWNPATETTRTRKDVATLDLSFRDICYASGKGKLRIELSLSLSPSPPCRSFLPLRANIFGFLILNDSLRPQQRWTYRVQYIKSIPFHD